MTLSGRFDTRRDAEMTVERLVQQFGIDRARISIAPEGSENTAGVEPAGSDDESAQSSDARDNSELNGRVSVKVDIADDQVASEVRSAFGEFDASDQQSA